MKTFLRAITTGFALSLGAALFRKISKHVGLDDKKPEDDDKKKKDDADADKERNPATDPVGAAGATDPGLRDRLS